MTFIVIPKLGNSHRRYRFGQRIIINSININLIQDNENGESPYTHEPIGSATICTIITSPHLVSEVIYTHFKLQSNKISSLQNL